jgi:16S rRNA U516 pseudouridylate synthase RsuA-like enzyme
MSSKPAAAQQQQFTYIKYWKPEGVVCTTDQRIADNVVDAVCAPPSQSCVCSLQVHSVHAYL